MALRRRVSPFEALHGPRLLLLLRAGHASAREHVLDTLRAHGGDVSATARALGVGSSSLYRACDRDPELASGFRRLALGRKGAARLGVQARSGFRSSNGPKRSGP